MSRAKVDEILESTSDAGVTIEQVLVKDGVVSQAQVYRVAPGLGNGVTDATAAIAAAIASAVAAGGAIVSLPKPANFYLVSGISAGGCSIEAEGGAEIRSTTGTVLTVTGALRLKGVTFTAPTGTAGAKGIANASYAVDAEGCTFTGNTNQAGDSGASYYKFCTFTSGSTLGSTAWSADSQFFSCRFQGQNGADVQGGQFRHCLMRGTGDGSTSGQGWGVHMPLTTNAIRPQFEYCTILGEGLNAYAMGLGNSGKPSLRSCILRGTKWGLFYRTDSDVQADNCHFYGGVYGVEFSKVLAAGTQTTTTATDSYFRQCWLDGVSYDLAVPTTSAYGLIYLENCSYGAVFATDALGGATETTTFVIGPQVGWHRNQLKVNAPASAAAGDEYVAANVGAYPIRRIFYGGFWVNYLYAHVATTAERPNPLTEFTGRLFFDSDTDAYVTRDATGAWRGVGDSKVVAFTSLDTTPSVKDANRFVTANAGATSITNFDDGYDGLAFILRAGDANTTIVHGGSIFCKGAANLVLAANDIVDAYREGGVYFCSVR